jgi:hypothetical protein
VTRACGVWVDGPLAPFATGFEEALAAEGYSKKWAQQLMGLTADLSRWPGRGWPGGRRPGRGGDR